jgi:hypothetical protein
MTRVYIIFCIVGWAWALVVGIFLLIKLRKREQRGFDIVDTDEKRN